MSILIKDMEMPKSCDICPFSRTNDNLMSDDYRFRYCDFPHIGEFVTDCERCRHPACPLTPVPPHGRLIDADALLQRAISHGWSTPKWVSDIVIDNAPPSSKRRTNK